MRRTSAKLPEVLTSLYRLEFWFWTRGGYLSNISGTIPWASVQYPWLLGAVPGSWPGSPPKTRPWGPTPAFPPHSFASTSPPQAPLSLEFQLKTQAKHSLLSWYIVIPLTFPKRRRSFPAPTRYHPRPGFHEAGAPTLAP